MGTLDSHDAVVIIVATNSTTGLLLATGAHHGSILSMLLVVVVAGPAQKATCRPALDWVALVLITREMIGVFNFSTLNYHSRKGKKYNLPHVYFTVLRD